MRAVLFVNGEIPDYRKFIRFIQPSDFLVAVDGGDHHILQLNLKPHIVIGDLDSISPEQIALYENEGIPIERYPVQKNETDLEIALQYVLQQGYSSIRIVAATGKRLDHTLGNIGLLSCEEYCSLDIRLEDGSQEIFFIDGSVEIDGNAGDLLSLLPYGVPAVGVVTRNLKYPLRNETLYPEKTRGISNVFLENRVSVGFQSGKLLCIHQRVEKQ